ncbi:MAG: hypothetical protein ACJ8F7_10485 [Gemmataceae bacterium]
MMGQSLRSVIRLTLVTIVIANGPVNLIAATACRAAPAGERPKASSCHYCEAADCCAEDEEMAVECGVADDAGPRPSPCSSSCPGYPCCLLCAAKAPCGLNAPRPVIDDAPCLEALPADLTFLSPHANPDDHFRPPRA